FANSSPSTSTPWIGSSAIPDDVDRSPPEPILPPETRMEFVPADSRPTMLPPETRPEFVPADSRFTAPGLPKVGPKARPWRERHWHLALVAILVGWWEIDFLLHDNFWFWIQFWFYFRWSVVYVGSVLAYTLSRRVARRK